MHRRESLGSGWPAQKNGPCAGFLEKSRKEPNYTIVTPVPQQLRSFLLGDTMYPGSERTTKMKRRQLETRPRAPQNPAPSPPWLSLVTCAINLIRLSSRPTHHCRLNPIILKSSMMSGQVDTLDELDSRLQAQVVAITRAGGRLMSIGDSMTNDRPDNIYTNAVMARLNREADILSDEAQKCVQLRADLQNFGDQLRQQEIRLKDRQEKLQKREQEVSGIQECIQKLDSMETRTGDYHRQAEKASVGFSKKLDDHRRQIEGIAESNKELYDYHRQAGEGIIDLKDKLDGQHCLIRRDITELRENVHSHNQRVDEGVVNLDNKLNDHHRQLVNNSQQVSEGTTNLDNKLENQSRQVQDGIADLKGELNKQTQRGDSLEGMLNRISEMTQSLNIEVMKLTGSTIHPEASSSGRKGQDEMLSAEVIKKLSLAKSSSYNSTSKRRRKSDSSLSEREDQEIDEHSREWLDRLKTVRKALRLPLEKTDSPLRIIKTRRLLMSCLSYQDKSPEYLQNFLSHNENVDEWICVGTLCQKNQIFRPDDDVCRDCSVEGADYCLEIKKDAENKAVVRVLS